jgi:hypothetical protein
MVQDPSKELSRSRVNILKDMYVNNTAVGRAIDIFGRLPGDTRILRRPDKDSTHIVDLLLVGETGMAWAPCWLEVFKKLHAQGVGTYAPVKGHSTTDKTEFRFSYSPRQIFKAVKSEEVVPVIPIEAYIKSISPGPSRVEAPPFKDKAAPVVVEGKASEEAVPTGVPRPQAPMMAMPYTVAITISTRLNKAEADELTSLIQLMAETAPTPSQ